MDDYYYVYKDDDQDYYYCSAKTKETTYIKPKNTSFLDPDTNEEYVFSSDADENSDAKKEYSDHDKEYEKRKQKERKNKKDFEEENVEEYEKDKEEEDANGNDDEDDEKEREKEKEDEQEDGNRQKQKNEKNQEKSKEKKKDKEQANEKDKEKRTKYFVYVDSQNKLYYVNAETQKSTYTKPENAKFLDPETNHKYIFEDSGKKVKKEKKDKKSKRVSETDLEPLSPKTEEDTTPKNKHKHARFSDIPGDHTPSPKKHHHHHHDKKKSSNRRKSNINFGDMVIDVPNEVSEFSYKSPPKTSAHQSFFPDTENLALPANLQEDIHKFQVDDYAKKFFKDHRTHHFFFRKKISPEALASFQDYPLSSSLLTSIPKNLQKSAVQMFNIILSYTGASKEKVKNPSISQLFSIVSFSPALRDELYFQLIKQTNNNPDESCLIKTWQIFVSAASVYPSSLDSEVWIKSHLSREAMKEKKTISDYAQFTYIRFSATCAKGKEKQISPLIINNLYKDVYQSSNVFGASIYEQLWNQRVTHKLYPIPIYVHEMAELLLKKGAEQTEGIFRHVGNKKTIIEIEEQINKGKPLDPDIQIHDLASLFKSWFSQLPDLLIPNSYVPKFQNAYEDGTFIHFAKKLPKAHFYTLKYLIGFLQRLVKSEEVTMMTASNFAICFSPDIISTQDIKDISAFDKFKKMSIKFLVDLINDLPTDDIYPLVVDA